MFWNPTTFTANPGATYKILVNGRSGGFRHQSIVDVEAMFQKLGAENGFDVDIWDPNINQGPGRQAPAGVSLPTSPLLDLATLSQYKTIVFDSTVGQNAAGLTSVEFANLQSYVRGRRRRRGHSRCDRLDAECALVHGSGRCRLQQPRQQCGRDPDRHRVRRARGAPLRRPGPSATSGIPEPFLSVEELYNTNRNPVEMGIVHPLVYENEDTLVGQIGYGTGTLMNTDQHAMTWCRNFEGGRSFTNTLGHSWQYMTEPWYQNMMLKAVEWTAGKSYANCVTYVEVADLLESTADAGDLDADGRARLEALLAKGRAEFDAEQYVTAASTFRVLADAAAEEAGSAGRASSSWPRRRSSSRGPRACADVRSVRPGGATRRRAARARHLAGRAVLLVGDVPGPRRPGCRSSSASWIAMWTMKRLGRRPCQRFSPGSKKTRSPAWKLLDRAAFPLTAAEALGDEDRLAERVRVPCGAARRQRREVSSTNSPSITCSSAFQQ